MAMNLFLKKCSINDLDILTEISRNTFIDAFEKDNNPNDFKTYIDSAFNKKQIESEILNVNSEFYFVYFNDKLVGYFKLNENEAQAEPYGNSFLELSRIYVLKQFQGKQIGKHILFQIIEMSKSKQKSFLWLGVWNKNKNAIRFYERFGFKKFDTHSFFIGDDKQTDWLMKLNLV